MQTAGDHARDELLDSEGRYRGEWRRLNGVHEKS
jgi:hypothetical protein